MKTYLLITRLAFFILYTWYGVLKVLNLGDAFRLVSDLCSVVIPSIDSYHFYFALGIIEIYIGVIFLFPKLTKLAVILAALHLSTTFLPYILLPNHIWSATGVLTFEGQYILKNLFIISALIGLWVNTTWEGKQKD